MDYSENSSLTSRRGRIRTELVGMKHRWSLDVDDVSESVANRFAVSLYLSGKSAEYHEMDILSSVNVRSSVCR